jgi:hypothetical protein
MVLDTECTTLFSAFETISALPRNSRMIAFWTLQIASGS